MNSRYAPWLLALAGAVVAALVLLPLFRGGTSRPSGPAGMVGQAAPVWPMKDDRGKTVTLSDYRGKVVVMNLWASWCPPCRAEMPDLQRLQDQYASLGVVVIGVNQGESAQRASAFANSLRINFPIWIDDTQRYGRVFTALGMPTTVVVGRDGNVVKGFDGALTLEQMRAAVNPLVNTR